MQVEKTVFISYRRTNAMTARAVYQHLTAHGYDCFLDYESIDSGSFERIILNQIAAKAHFVVIFTPSALERCDEPGDWLRREIEYALEQNRNIVPLMFEGFRYSDVQKYLTGKLAIIPQYNSLEIPSAYFEEAMTRLENRFLNKSLDVILRPIPNVDKPVVAEAKAKVEQQPVVTEKNLSAEEWFERGLRRSEEDYIGKIADYSKVIELNPKLAEGYNNRGVARYNKQDYDAAIADYSKAIRLNPKLAGTYYNRGNARNNKQDYDAAITDYSEAIRLNPKYAEAYNNRGAAHYNKQEYDNAITDYSEAIRLNPKYAEAYNNRGVARYNKQDYRGAIADETIAINLNPKAADTYINRGIARKAKSDLDGAIADFEAVLRIDPNDALAKQILELTQTEKANQRK